MKYREFRKTPLAIAVSLALLGAGAGMSTTAIAGGDDIADLREQIEALQRKVDDIEVRQTDTAEQTRELSSTAIRSGGSPGSFTTANGRTKFEVSGYVKLDGIVDLDADVGDSFVASSIPADGTPAADKNPHTRFHARQSRLRFMTDTELDSGRHIKTHIEGDFFGGGGNESFSNSTGFRIRHAYGSYDTEWGSFLAGQYWTNFMDFVAYPGTVDFFGPAGKSFKRQGQIRWTMNNGLSISLENPETDGFGAAGRLGESRGGIGADEVPDVTVAWRGGTGNANYELAAVWRKLGVNGVAPAGSVLAGTRLDDSESGFGINLAGGWSFDRVNLSASTTFGDGIGSYIINGFGNDLWVNADGSIETVESMSVNAAIKVDWTDSTSSTLALGHFENDIPSRSNGINTLDTMHLNFMWNPWPSTTMGVELMRGELDNADGTSGEANRLQFMVQRSF